MGTRGELRGTSGGSQRTQLKIRRHGSGAEVVDARTIATHALARYPCRRSRRPDVEFWMRLQDGPHLQDVLASALPPVGPSPPSGGRDASSAAVGVLSVSPDNSDALHRHANGVWPRSARDGFEPGPFGLVWQMTARCVEPPGVEPSWRRRAPPTP